MKITIKIFENDEEIVNRTFEPGTYKIGRGEKCDVVLSDESVSREHLEVRLTESAIYVTNLSGGGKVLINGEALETAEAQSGDQIRIGPYRIVIFEGTLADLHVENSPSYDSNVSPSDSSPPAMPGDMPEFPSEGNVAVDSETMVQMRPVVAKIMFTEGPNNGSEFFIEAYDMTLGRSRKADIFIDDDKLSRIHARISRVGQGYRLIDLNSRNGTYVNGMRVLEHPLSSFDEIALGHSKIRFMIHDMANDLGQGGGTKAAAEQTRSVQMDEDQQVRLMELAKRRAPPAVPPRASDSDGTIYPDDDRKKTQFLRIAIIMGLLGLTYLYMSSQNVSQDGEETDQAQSKAVPSQSKRPVISDSGAKGESRGKDINIAIPRSLPKQYGELPLAMQRAMEGHWKSALRSADRDLYKDAINHLKKIHDVIPYYKNSRSMMKNYKQKIKRKQILRAKKRAKKTERQDLAIYLEEGIGYLKAGDFAAAAEAFNGGIVIDPNNAIAIKGLKAAQKKIRDINKVPPDKDPEAEKRKLIGELFKQAVESYLNKSYQKAISIAEKIRKVELQGETRYLSEAKQIIDKAKQQQKEEFEPFLIQAKEKYAEGDYNAARDLCEEMVKRDPEYEPAVDLLAKSKKQLTRLAKDNYVRGIILESMNKIDEAMQYWNRGKNYVRPGDDYYDKIYKKLDNYQ